MLGDLHRGLRGNSRRKSEPVSGGGRPVGPLFRLGKLQVHLLQPEIALATVFVVSLPGQGLAARGLLFKAIGTHRVCTCHRRTDHSICAVQHLLCRNAT